MKIISRAEAKAAGLKHYFTGKPCPAGHLTERYVSSRGCVKCVEAKSEEYKSSPAGKAAVVAYSRSPKARDYQAKRRATLEHKTYMATYGAAWSQTPQGRQSQKKNRAKRKSQGKDKRNHHERTYREPMEARFDRFTAQHCCDDLSGEAARFAEMHQDHDHDTGQLRGLISGKNNTAIGMLGDSPLRCAQAANYLVRHAAADASHPLLADQQALADIKSEADRLSAMVAKLLCPTKQTSTPPTSETAGRPKPCRLIALNGKPLTNSSDTTSSQNFVGQSRKSA